MPKISILLPVFNAAKTLEACLRSLLRQTMRDWECVLVDDGSQDEGAKLADGIARIDPRIRVMRTPHRGLVPALSAGLAECRAPLVARMDADDCMHRNRLARQLAHFEITPGLAALGSHVRIFPRSSLRDGRRAYEGWLNGIGEWSDVARERFIECPVAHPTLMIQRELLQAFGYTERNWPEDYDLILRLIEAGHRVDVLPERLLSWRDTPGRLSRTDRRYHVDRFTECKAHYLARGPLAGTEQYTLWGYGGTGRALRRALLAEGRTPSRIIEVHPGRLGNTIHGVPVVPPSVLEEGSEEPIVVSVAGAKARTQIRSALAHFGLVEIGIDASAGDFICTA